MNDPRLADVTTNRSRIRPRHEFPPRGKQQWRGQLHGDVSRLIGCFSRYQSYSGMKRKNGQCRLASGNIGRSWGECGTSPQHAIGLDQSPLASVFTFTRKEWRALFPPRERSSKSSGRFISRPLHPAPTFSATLAPRPTISLNNVSQSTQGGNISEKTLFYTF